MPSIKRIGTPTSTSAPSDDHRSLQTQGTFLDIINDITAPITGLFEGNFNFFRPNEYILQPINSFVIHFVCTDAGRAGCNQFNTLQFTNSAVIDPPPNGFRYHDSGPLQLQGVFWTQQNTLTNAVPALRDMIPASQLVSFARTRHGMWSSSSFV